MPEGRPAHEVYEVPPIRVSRYPGTRTAEHVIGVIVGTGLSACSGALVRESERVRKWHWADDNHPAPDVMDFVWAAVEKFEQLYGESNVKEKV